ncbi:hypothetical protein T08_9166 [Trichinella sp. T8]|uniref:Uncharacterized protein n=1 Tax=Trichinella murrelli TaxID=144512 RepID=A0A0V0U188_9BILA|nr:hypothetical protein T05_14696 [Trichinella murrelli]KRZ96738.1 hypothetical protein T08_9166 [Trichinella sp. T8]
MTNSFLLQNLKSELTEEPLDFFPITNLFLLGKELQHFSKDSSEKRRNLSYIWHRLIFKMTLAVAKFRHLK